MYVLGSFLIVSAVDRLVLNLLSFILPSQVHFDVSVGSGRGVYLRQPDESSVRQTCSVTVDPCFRTNDDVAPETQRQRIEFEMEFDLKSTASWVKSPEHFMLMHNGRTFKIEVDPTGLPPGVHTAKVLASNDGVVMFSVPITVVRHLPNNGLIDLGKLEVSCFIFFHLTFQLSPSPSHIHRSISLLVSSFLV